MANHITLGQTIQDLRQQSGLTQDGLSDRAGLAYSTLAKIERGAIKNPSVFTIASIARVLEVSVEDLVGNQSSVPVLDSDPNQGIQFVYCDINGVLVRFFQRAFVTLSRQTSLNLDKIETTFWHYNDAANRGEMSLDEFNTAMCQHLGIKDFDWYSLYLDSVEPIFEMHECLKTIIADCKVGLLSNISAGLIDGLREKGLIPDLNYATIVDSSEVGAIKPENEMYTIAEKQAGYSGSQILFIDDSRTNIMAAERRGWRVLWFDDYRPDESVKRVQEALKSPL